MAYSTLECIDHFKKSKERINGEKYNYCWKFVPFTRSAKSANIQCHGYRGRLVAITSASKAKKLSAFVKEIVQHGTGRGRKVKKKFKEVWISDIKDGKWRAKGFKVDKKATNEAAIKPGAHCVVFNYVTAKWRYEKCSKSYYMICESTKVMLPDDVDAEDKPFPPSSLKPTPPPPVGAKLSCPPRYFGYGKHCYFIGQVTETQAQAETTCHKTGGNLVWISDNAKYNQVKGVVRSHRGKFKKILHGAWLMRLEGNGFIIKWKEFGTNARFLFNKETMQFRSNFEKGKMPNLYIYEDGSIYKCFKKCMDVGAFCESPRRVLTEKEQQLAAKIATEKKKTATVKKTNAAKKAAKRKQAKAKIAAKRKQAKKIVKAKIAAKRKQAKKIVKAKKTVKTKKAKKIVKTHQSKSQKHLNRNSKSKSSKPLKKQNSYTHKEKPKTQYLNKPKTKIEEETSVLEPEQTSQTPAKADNVTQQMKPQTTDMSKVNKSRPMKKDPDESNVAVKSNEFLSSSGSSHHVTIYQYHIFLLTCMFLYDITGQ
ncbi:uncharacterized protein LOC132717262 [Ruditapes philippinarum]|uniref:uncharacterized protein LOC132717262 n=1 Tax=Ruditapes philippinarum TaxID=129788 RepID=UPI00295C3577|nr:uncharacterized protein LOC132717262 [Ruditapes philippinarum]